jgi:hypothetical protein
MLNGVNSKACPNSIITTEIAIDTDKKLSLKTSSAFIEIKSMTHKMK